MCKFMFQEEEMNSLNDSDQESSARINTSVCRQFCIIVDSLKLSVILILIAVNDLSLF